MVEPLSLTTPFSLNHYQVEPERDRISFHEEHIKLEPKVMSVLVYLAHHHQRVISVDELINEVWEGAAVSRQSVQRCVSVLRKMFSAANDGVTYISTFPKKGYQLSVNPHFPKQTPSTGRGATISSASSFWQTPWFLLGGALLLLAAIGVIWLSYASSAPQEPLTPSLTTKVTKSGQFDYAFSLHPDGKTLAYIRRDEGKSFSLYLRSRKGEEQLIKKLGFVRPNMQLAWSPSGHQLLAMWHNAISFIYLFDVDPADYRVTRERLLSDDPNYRYGRLSWLDEEHLLITRTLITESEHELYKVPLASFDFIPYPGTKFVHYAHASEGYIAYIQYDYRQRHVRLFDPKQQELLTYTTEENINEIIWLPDHSGVLYLAEGEPKILMLDGQRKALTLGLDGKISNPLFSDDGRELYFIRYLPNQDLWQKEKDLQPACCQLVATSITHGQEHSGRYRTDGQISFVSNASGLNQVWLQAPEQPAQVITQLNAERSLSDLFWSEDNQLLLFKADSDILLYSAVTQTTQDVVTHKLFVTPLGFDHHSEFFYFSDMNYRGGSFWRHSIQTGDREMLNFKASPEQVIVSQGELYFIDPTDSYLYRWQATGSEKLSNGFPKDTRFMAENSQYLFYSLPRENQRKQIWGYNKASGEHSEFLDRAAYIGSLMDINEEGTALLSHDAIEQREIFKLALK